MGYLRGGIAHVKGSSGNVVRVPHLSLSCETILNSLASLVLEKAVDLEVVFKIEHSVICSNMDL